MDTVLITSKSTSWSMSIVELSSLFVSSGSGVSLVTLTMLVITDFVTSTFVLMYNTLVSPLAISPIVQVSVDTSYTPSPLDSMKIKPAGKTSIATAFTAVSGPLLVTVIVHVMLSPLRGP